LVLAQAAVIERLEARVAELERQIGRHSGNSSLPPSRDPQEQRESRAERRRAAREAQKEQRRAGKQPGAPGAHLAQVPDPDRVVVHAPGECRGCGADLADAPVEDVERRQVFDLPEQRREVTEHRVERRRCACGCRATAAFPVEARAPACWGPRVRAYAIYLLVRQHLPVERTAELLADMLGAPVSTGWLATLPKEGAEGLSGFMDDLATRVADSDVVHADETGTRVAGAKWWLNVACTVLLTYLAVHRRRGGLPVACPPVLDGGGHLRLEPGSVARVRDAARAANNGGGQPPARCVRRLRRLSAGCGYACLGGVVVRARLRLCAGPLRARRWALTGTGLEPAARARSSSAT